MATLGKTVIGLTEFGVTGSAIAYLTGPYMASEDGTIDSISVYTTTTGVNLRLGVYLHDENHPTSARPAMLIAATDAAAITIGGWQTQSRTSGSGAIERGKRYWLAFIASGDIEYRLNYSEEKWWYNQSGPYPTLRNPFLVGGGSTLTRAISAYLTYTPAETPAEDTTLQGMVNRASPGSIVRIPYGFYNERLVINKPMTLIGIPDRRGRPPVIQGGQLIPEWMQSTEPEHIGKNVWYYDVRIGAAVARWIRSLQLGDRGVQVLQAKPDDSGEGVTQAQATTMREYLLTNDWSDPGFFVVAGQTIDFWEWYNAIACHDATGRLWIRLKNSENPNDSICYVTATQRSRTGQNDDWAYTAELASVIKVENQSDVTIRNLEIRGGRYGIDVHNSSNVIIEHNRLLVPALRSINILDSANVRIENNQITSNWMHQNVGPGFGGTSDRAKAMQFGWSLNKNYSVSGHPSPRGSSVELCGVSSGVVVRRNNMHHQGTGMHVGFGFDVHAIDVTIENNVFSTMDSTGVVIYPRATGVIRNNRFYEVHLNFRIQEMNQSTVFNALETEMVIQGNTIESLENAGYVIQAHYNTGTTWTTPIIFVENIVKNVSTLIANQLGIADVDMDGNVLVSGFPSSMATHGVASFTRNWVGGNAEGVKNLPWFDASNQYSLGQDIEGEDRPPGFESAGAGAQSIGPHSRFTPGSQRLPPYGSLKTMGRGTVR